jgi:hypothetical protein
MAGSGPSFRVRENQPRNPSWQVHPDAGREWQPRDNPEVSPFGGRGRARARPKLTASARARPWPQHGMMNEILDVRSSGRSAVLGSRSCRHASPPHSRHEAAGLGKDIRAGKTEGTRREHGNNPRLRVCPNAHGRPRRVHPPNASSQCILRAAARWRRLALPPYARIGRGLMSSHRRHDAATDRDARRLQCPVGLRPRRGDKNGGARF